MPTVINRQLNPTMYIASDTIPEGPVGPAAVPLFTDDYVVLSYRQELSYRVPANTTVVRVYGPVGTMDHSKHGNRCYAGLDPQPPWWRNGSFPISASWKVLNATNRTLFILPVDPEVPTTVKIGSFSGGSVDTSCFLSGISSYPFH